jgi:hypothetical protein
MNTALYKLKFFFKQIVQLSISKEIQSRSKSISAEPGYIYWQECDITVTPSNLLNSPAQPRLSRPYTTRKTPQPGHCLFSSLDGANISNQVAADTPALTKPSLKEIFEVQLAGT